MTWLGCASLTGVGPTRARRSAGVLRVSDAGRAGGCVRNRGGIGVGLRPRLCAHFEGAARLARLKKAQGQNSCLRRIKAGESRTGYNAEWYITTGFSERHGGMTGIGASRPLRRIPA